MLFILFYCTMYVQRSSFPDCIVWLKNSHIHSHQWIKCYTLFCIRCISVWESIIKVYHCRYFSFDIYFSRDVFFSSPFVEPMRNTKRRFHWCVTSSIDCTMHKHIAIIYQIFCFQFLESNESIFTSHSHSSNAYFIQIKFILYENMAWK